jgi:hypothetical protein
VSNIEIYLNDLRIGHRVFVCSQKADVLLCSIHDENLESFLTQPRDPYVVDPWYPSIDLLQHLRVCFSTKLVNTDWYRSKIKHLHHYELLFDTVVKGYPFCSVCRRSEWLIRITPCVPDEIHTGALFRVFSKSCFFSRDSQNPATILPPKCVWGSFVQLLIHTAVLFKQQTCQLDHGRLTQFHGVCISGCVTRILPVTFHRGHVVTSSPGTILTVPRLHVFIFFRNGSYFPHVFSQLIGTSISSQLIAIRVRVFKKKEFVLSKTLQKKRNCEEMEVPISCEKTCGKHEPFRKKMKTCNRGTVSIVPGEEVTT